MSSNRPIPDSVPRQKTCMYIGLICLTTLLIYIYSYPLNMENWTYSRQKIPEDVDSNREEPINVSNINPSSQDTWNLFDSAFLRKLFPDARTTVGKQLKSTASEIFQSVTKSDDIPVDYTKVSPAEIENTGKQEDGMPTAGNKAETLNEAQSDSATLASGIMNVMKAGVERSITSVNIVTNGNVTPAAIKLKDTATVSTKKSTVLGNEAKPTNLPPNTSLPIKKPTENSSQYKAFTRKSNSHEAAHELTRIARSTPQSTLREISVKSATTNTSEDLSGLQKGYLVFSEHCRIPDIDPMHSSIAHLIEKTPPLDCSENHKPLTWTEGHGLFLNRTAALERTAGDNYTCCYRSVFREKEGLSDNGVGFGKVCINITQKATIEDEFITVECKYQNDTTFYKEFHSFIFDKPKVEKRCGNGTDSQYSVLIIGVDAISRLNMHRQLNATAGYLLREMDAIEMYGFNKVGDNTFPNLIPVLVGYDERELSSVCWKSKNLPLDRCDFLWKKFAEKGYRTLYAEDSPHISSFNYVKLGFYHQPTDYYFRHFILAYEDDLGRDKPLNCYLCVGSTSETEAVLHWTGQFASHFASRPYFAFSWINSITHDFLNMGSSADHMYERFFRTLHQTGALDKTIVVLMGDHGMRWGEIRKTYVGRLEERLPMLMIALPEKFKRNYPKFAKVLRQNSHRLVTPFDLHATLAHLLDLTNDWSLGSTNNVDNELSENFSKRALSLFQPIPEDRSCDEAFIEEHWCTCETSLEVDIHSDEVKRVAKFLLNRINNLLKPVSDKCSFLRLDSVSDARLWQPPAEHRGHSAADSIYTVVIHTSPSKAAFEGTVKATEPKMEIELLGTISRVNLYGNQSLCIDDAILKKYCYCL